MSILVKPGSELARGRAVADLLATSTHLDTILHILHASQRSVTLTDTSGKEVSLPRDAEAFRTMFPPQDPTTPSKFQATFGLNWSDTWELIDDFMASPDAGRKLNLSKDNAAAVRLGLADSYDGNYAKREVGVAGPGGPTLQPKRAGDKATRALIVGAGTGERTAFGASDGKPSEFTAHLALILSRNKPSQTTFEELVTGAASSFHGDGGRISSTLGTAAVAGPAAKGEGSCRALLVGGVDFGRRGIHDGDGDLASGAPDVHVMDRELRRYGFETRSSIDPSAAKTLSAMRTLIDDVPRGGRAVIYVSAHGSPEGSLWLPEPRPEGSYIDPDDMAEVQSHARRAGVNLTIVVDACYAGMGAILQMQGVLEELVRDSVTASADKARATFVLKALRAAADLVEADQAIFEDTPPDADELRSRRDVLERCESAFRACRACGIDIEPFSARHFFEPSQSPADLRGVQQRLTRALEQLRPLFAKATG